MIRDIGTVTIYFYDLVLSQLGFEHLTFRLRGERSNPLRHRRGTSIMNGAPPYWCRYWLDTDVLGTLHVYLIAGYATPAILRKKTAH